MDELTDTRQPCASGADEHPEKPAGIRGNPLIMGAFQVICHQCGRPINRTPDNEHEHPVCLSCAAKPPTTPTDDQRQTNPDRRQTRYPLGLTIFQEGRCVYIRRCRHPLPTWELIPDRLMIGYLEIEGLHLRAHSAFEELHQDFLTIPEAIEWLMQSAKTARFYFDQVTGA